uniref:2-amino-4-hydroxy-6-hydroxymethyldihydropteridine diphosphokinase n=1 Tax=mine drainage metagenome TaxID=410659 RepID=E6Q7U5_9ZZZZ
MMALATIGVGANIGAPCENVERAIEALRELGVLTARSSLYRSAPWGKREQPEFINAVARIETALAPRALLASLQAIERRLGRVPGERWGPRAIDLDILLYDDLGFEDDALRIPHRDLFERAFVLVPLAEIDASFEAWRDALPPVEQATVERIVVPAE